MARITGAFLVVAIIVLTWGVVPVAAQDQEHLVRPGETLIHIAQRYGLDVAEIMQANDLPNAHTLRAGQRLTIPTRPTGYTVRAGESLSVIAARHGTTVGELMQLNNLSSANHLRVGQEVLVPGRVAEISRSGEQVIASESRGEANYVVRPGESLSLIAARHGATVAELIRLNNLSSSDYIRAGQELFVPEARGEASSAAEQPTTASNDDERNYVVGPGDTLGAIATRHGTTTAELMRLNGLSNAGRIFAGQRLQVPDSNENPAQSISSESTTTVSEDNHYTVRPGDTLGAVAARYDTTVAALMIANELTNPSRIVVGQKLILPAGASTEAPEGEGTRFVVSISQQRCWVWREDVLLYDWPCSTGRWGHNTLPGTYHIQSKMDKAFGSTWSIWMPYWLGIYWAGSTENGIHGLPYNATTGTPVWSGYVGTPITYGCVMLDNEHARILYELAYIGMPVIINP